jgi:hemoglobin-like flavoprotein
MTMIGVAVRGLGNLAALAPAVQNLGRRHAGYGVKPEHYAIVGAALLWTLEQGLGNTFSAEVKAAWTEAYAHLAGIMQEAAAVPA